MAGLVVGRAVHRCAGARLLTVNDPSQQNARAAFHPPQGLHLIDTSADVAGRSARTSIRMLKRDPVTLAAIYQKIPSARFICARSAKATSTGAGTVQPGRTSSLRERASRCSSSAPTGWAMRLQPHHAGHADLPSVGLSVSSRADVGIVLGGISAVTEDARLRDPARDRLVLSLPTIPIWLAMAAAPEDCPGVNYFMIASSPPPAGRARAWCADVEPAHGGIVMAARLDGVSEKRIIFRHMLPSFASHIIASVSLAIPAMILARLRSASSVSTAAAGLVGRPAAEGRTSADRDRVVRARHRGVIAVIALNSSPDCATHRTRTTNEAPDCHS